MKRHMTRQQHEELLSLGYVGDDSLLSMVEFLEESHNLNLNSWQEWTVTIDEGPGTEVEFSDFHLCDALWEAVKKVLDYEHI